MNRMALCPFTIVALGAVASLGGCATSEDETAVGTGSGGRRQASTSSTGGSTDEASAEGLGGTDATATPGAGGSPAEPAATGGTTASPTSAAATGGAEAGDDAPATVAAGVIVDGVCTLLCADDSTDADQDGVTDGWGYETGGSCVVPGGTADTGEACDDPAVATAPENPSTAGAGVLVDGECQLVCADGSTDADAEGVTDGWGYERGVSCVVPGSTADTGEVCTDLPADVAAASTPGGTVEVDGECLAVCADDSTDADDEGVTDGWGYENDASCIVPGSVADTGTPCGETDA